MSNVIVKKEKINKAIEIIELCKNDLEYEQKILLDFAVEQLKELIDIRSCFGQIGLHDMSKIMGGDDKLQLLFVQATSSVLPRPTCEKLMDEMNSYIVEEK